MANKQPRPDEIVTKLRKIEKLTAQGMRLWMPQIGGTEQTHYRWNAGG